MLSTSGREKAAFITGVTGQDGKYLSEHLLALGYRVHGLVRPTSQLGSLHLGAAQSNKTSRLTLHIGDVLDPYCLLQILASIEVDEIYHLAAQSHVGYSFSMPQNTTDVDALGTMRLLRTITALKLEHKVRFYNACSSEVYGPVLEGRQNETSPFQPSSPYAAAKAYAYWMTKSMRISHGLYATNGILFNHESPHRGAHFVTRKITIGVAMIALGKAERITLGNLDACRDWGHAKDYVRGMHLMLQKPVADDYVLATGVSRSVRQFAEAAFHVVGICLKWEGSGATEVGLDASDNTVRVSIDKAVLRPLDLPYLCGDAAKAKETLAWRTEISFTQMMKEMVEADLERVRSSNSST